MTTTTNDLETVKDFLTNGRIDEIRQPSKYVPLTVILTKGIDSISLRKGNDGKWRYTYHSTYGNGSFVWSGDATDLSGGGAYDASGFIIKDAKTIKSLEAMTGAAK